MTDAPQDPAGPYVEEGAIGPDRRAALVGRGLIEALARYAWHGRHHTAQVLWLRQRHGWPPPAGRNGQGA